ncbi:MAG: hypothetical protein B6D44_00805 [Ignavibacteriales bacterium UTCHB2]|jgi:type II secretory pathway component PulJ|nr:MAG: hypothetical protein B6D44_00805 [Ignavibacteriales bacterium UTCHB2]
MGFSTILDIVGSIIIGGILLTIAMRLNDSATAKTYNNSAELSLQENIATIAQTLEIDFRKIGYCADWNKFPDPSKAIVYADESSIKYLIDLDSDTNMDSILYFLGPTSELLSTPNPRDRMLYRVVNNEVPKSANLGVTQFRLVYFDALGDTIITPITTPGLINSIEINLAVESVAAYDTAYTGAFWRQIRLVARNLRNR